MNESMFHKVHVKKKVSNSVWVKQAMKWKQMLHKLGIFFSSFLSFITSLRMNSSKMHKKRINKRAPKTLKINSSGFNRKLCCAYFILLFASTKTWFLNNVTQSESKFILSLYCYRSRTHIHTSVGFNSLQNVCNSLFSC